MSRKHKIQTLLKGIETGDAAAAAVVNEAKYIQHNPQTHQGSEGLAALFKRLSELSPRVNIVRLFEDGDFVFGHTEYDFEQANIGFEVFRFEGDFAVEHWDNIQRRVIADRSDSSLVDGPSEAIDLDKTEESRELVRSFVTQVLIGQRADQIEQFIDGDNYREHNPHNLGVRAALSPHIASLGTGEACKTRYTVLHRVLAEGSFVLAASEGLSDEVHTSFYDLFRVASGKVVEHWDTIEAIPPRAEWKNDNGKF